MIVFQKIPIPVIQIGKGNIVMRYMGGKERISKDLASFLNKIACKLTVYWEPFCGGISVVSKVICKNRIATDLHPVVNTYIEYQKGWRPNPDEMTERMYRAIRHVEDENPLKHLMGFGMSYCGTYFHGYAGDNSKYSAINSLERKMKTSMDVIFKQCDYREFILPEYKCLIYCDPPYQNTSEFDKVSKFDHTEFWKWAEEKSKNHVVLVSEYSAPIGWECVWERKTRMTLRYDHNDILDRGRSEKLFICSKYY